jgi:hypothetical protein
MIIAPRQFAVAATGGAGQPNAATVRSMAFFRGALYLGTSCENIPGADDAPRILRSAAPPDGWETVYESPLTEPGPRALVPDRQIGLQLAGRDFSSLGRRRSDRRVPRDVGYRAMCVFQARSDPEPALYVSTMSRGGGRLLRSQDGRNFAEVGPPGLGNPDLYSLTGLTAMGGLLFAIPAGVVSNEALDPDRPPEATVYVSDDPGTGNWRAAVSPAFGDPRNIAVSGLAAAHGYLYAGTINPHRGFQLWRTAAAGEPPYAWQPIVNDGAGSFSRNLAAAAMAEFDGALYVGSGMSGYGYDIEHDVGPASAELVRVYPDGTWDLIAGHPRFSEAGLKVPLSLLGAGFGDFYNATIPALAAHDGALYLGTRQWEAVRTLDLGADRIVGGYQLWASENGEDWHRVIEDGRGNPAQIDIAALASTPLGLAVGTGNHSHVLGLLGLRHNRSDLRFADGFEVLLGAARPAPDQT